jgi:hypothetical protein
MLEANLPHFARDGALQDFEHKYARFQIYNPAVQCPPGRGLMQYGGWQHPQVRGR